MARKLNFAEAVVLDAHSCARCGDRFMRFGRGYVCPRCRKPKNNVATKEKKTFSNREQQIVDLIMKAKTNKEIAYALCLTEGTVKEYLHRIFRKMNVTNRTQLALKCNGQLTKEDGADETSLESTTPTAMPIAIESRGRETRQYIAEIWEAITILEDPGFRGSRVVAANEVLRKLVGNR
jgi:DNA-binding CsgD family transcriptional regulator